MCIAFDLKSEGEDYLVPHCWTSNVLLSSLGHYDVLHSHPQVTYWFPQRGTSHISLLTVEVQLLPTWLVGLQMLQLYSYKRLLALQLRIGS